jgi:hypothetical protein
MTSLSRPPRAENAEQPNAKAGPVPERVPARVSDETAHVASGAPVGRDGGLPYPLIALAALAPVLLVSGLVSALARRRR